MKNATWLPTSWWHRSRHLPEMSRRSCRVSAATNPSGFPSPRAAARVRRQGVSTVLQPLHSLRERSVFDVSTLPCSLLSLLRRHFQPELFRIAKIAKVETIEESKTGDAFKAIWWRRHADHSDNLVQPKCRKLDTDPIRWKGAPIGTLKRDRVIRGAVRKQTVILIQNEFKRTLYRAGTSVSEESSRHGLTALRQGEQHFDGRLALMKWPLDLSHQGRLQISSTVA